MNKLTEEEFDEYSDSVEYYRDHLMFTDESISTVLGPLPEGYKYVGFYIVNIENNKQVKDQTPEEKEWFSKRHQELLLQHRKNGRL